MARPAKVFNKEETITSLTVPHENCAEPDQLVFTAQELDEFTDEQLESLRSSTKRKRPPRTGGSTLGAPRATFNKTGVAFVKIPVTLTEDQRKSLATLDHRTEKNVSGYLSQFITSTSDSGAGAGAFIPKEQRPDGCVIFNANKVVASAIDGVVEAAMQEKRFAKMTEVYDLINGNRKMREATNKSLPSNRHLAIESDEEIRLVMETAASNAGYTEEQTADIIDRLFAGS
jgi:hypothetical protein